MATNRVGIYEIFNLLNGKRYVGSTVKFSGRFWTHKRALRNGLHHSLHLQRSWNKHGSASFTFRPILFCSRSTLLLYEQICIDALKPEYNVSLTAGSRLGIKNTPEHNAKIGNAHRGKVRGPLSIETRQKLRDIGIKANRPPPPMSPEVKARVDAAKRGRKQSPESIEKRAIALRAVMNDLDYKARAVACLRSANDKRIANARKATSTPEFAKNSANRMKKTWSDPDFRAKTVAATRSSQNAAWKAKHAVGIARVQADPEFHRRRNEGQARARAYRNALINKESPI